jgi:hypothetical protein
MTEASWKFVFASVCGTSHEGNEAGCQDVSDCRVLKGPDDTEVLIAMAADGAGSAKRALEGAALACSLFLSEMEALFSTGGTVADISLEFAKDWLTRFQNEVVARATAEELSPREFACTFLAAILGEESSVFLQVGDGLIVIPSAEEPEEYCWAFWPQRGEYANMTNFATDANVGEKLEHNLVNHRIDEVAVLTDGLQNLTVQYETQLVHTPFFRPIFEWLRPAAEASFKNLTTSMIAYLQSEKINERTDDDKTLILATRRPAAPSSIDDLSFENNNAGKDL